MNGMDDAATPHRRPSPPRLDDACALFLDVDGTLLDFEPDPERVRLPEGTLPIIESLSDRLRGAVALVSGGPLQQLDRLFAPLQLPSAGLHGHEFRGSPVAGARTAPPGLARLKEAALLLAQRHPGIGVEDKGTHLALHWRAAPQFAGEISALAQAHIGAIEGYRLQPGDHVIELVPAGTDKGRAVRELMQQAPFVGRTPVFVGDDFTDEYGFAAANALGGWSVRVGHREPSHATHTLAGTAAVHAWLHANAAPFSLPASGFSA